MDNKDIIHVHIYDPDRSLFGKKSDRAEIHRYSCPRANECDAYKTGRCILVSNPLGPACFGRKSVETGPTRRAKSFRDFIRKGKEHEKYGALERQPNKIFRVGDGYMMPYPHINLSPDSPFEDKADFMRSGFPYLEAPTKEKISKIFTQRPHAFMGGEIRAYQEKVVPEIVRHLHDEYPELYEMLADAHPEASSVVQNFDYTGKRAVLETLLPGEFVEGEKARKKWYWDGEQLIGDGGNMLFAPAKAAEVRIKPKEGATVKVTNNDMVGDQTKIVD